jgi:Flp pilus assembly pilin Flp|tara:strand:+ start:729 stop:1628 length:900 start_codon:yes stop_codon:yes gene_type:complete
MKHFFTTNQKGSAIVEYGLLAGLVAVVAIASVSRLGQTIAHSFEDTASNLEASQSLEGPAASSGGEVVADPNIVITEDAPSTAAGAPEIDKDGTVTASFEEGDDTDFYMVRLSETSDFNAVATDSDGRVVRQTALYDSNNKLLGYNWAATWDPTSKAGAQANDLPPGDYFVRVLAEPSAVGDYTITTSTRHDVGNSPDTATDISFGVPIVSDFVVGDYQDFFKIVLAQDGPLNVLVENLDHTMEKQVAIFDTSDRVVGYSWGEPTQTTHSESNLSAGTYYIRLERDGSDNGQYRITVTQ